jgi:hypothetical protein
MPARGYQSLLLLVVGVVATGEHDLDVTTERQ